MNVSWAWLRWRFIRFLCAASVLLAATAAGERIAYAGNVSVITLGAPSPQVSGVPFTVTLTMQSSGISANVCVQPLTGVSGGTVTLPNPRMKCAGTLADGQMATLTWTPTFTLNAGSTTGNLNFIAFVSWDDGSFSQNAPPIQVIAASSPAQLSLLSVTPSTTSVFAGTSFTVDVVVRNPAPAGANNANINLVTLLPSGGGANPVCGPPTASGSGPLAPLATRTFSYICQSNVSGVFNMAANVAGTDAVTGQVLTAGPLLSPAITVNSPAAGLQVTSVAPSPTAADGGQTIAVDVSVKNTALVGGHDATFLAVALSANVPTIGNASALGCTETSAPNASPLAPQASRQFSFNCTAIGFGSFTFKADATGSDVGTPISASGTSPAVTVADGISPTVSISPSPVPWSAMDLSFEITATDNTNGSGVSGIAVQVDGGSLMQIPGASASVSLSVDGSHTISFFATDNAGNNSTTTMVTAGIDRGSPTISSSQSPPAVAGWNNSAVTVTFACADALSGVQSCTAPVSLAAETAGTNVPGTAADQAGNTATTTHGPVRIDLTAPEITGAALESPNGAGWHKQAVTVRFTCTDALSGIATCPGDLLVSTEGAGQSASGTATDVAGNSATGSAGGLNIDLTAPVIDGSRAPAANMFGWNNGAVTASFTCSDALSGVASCPAAQTVSGEGAGQSASGTATDVAGNSSSATVGGINIDLTGPTIAGAASAPANFAGWNNGPVTVHFTCADALSGIDSCTPDVVFAMEGMFSAMGAATDRAGNGAMTGAMFPVLIDLTSPVVVVPASPVVAEATGAAGAAVAFMVSAQDMLSGYMPGSLGCMTAAGNVQSGAVFPIGTTAVTCAALDMAGNVGTGSFTVVVGDTTAPVVSPMSNISVETTNAGGTAVSFTTPTATDLVDGAVAVTCSPASGAVYPIGVTTVVCSATDQASNTGTTSFSITVILKTGTPPVIGKVPGTNAQNQLIAYATSVLGAFVNYKLPTAKNSAGQTIPVTCAPPPNSKFKVGQTTVTCTATDAAGNTATATFTMWVQYEVTTQGGVIFQQPINSDGSSIFRIGTVIPVQFALKGASAGIKNLVAKIKVVKISDTITGTQLEKPCILSPDSGDTFRYDSYAKEYVFNLATSTGTKGTWELSADLGDGVVRSVRGSLKP